MSICWFRKIFKLAICTFRQLSLTHVPLTKPHRRLYLFHVRRSPPNIKTQIPSIGASAAWRLWMCLCPASRAKPINRTGCIFLPILSNAIPHVPLRSATTTKNTTTEKSQARCRQSFNANDISAVVCRTPSIPTTDGFVVTVAVLFVGVFCDARQGPP